MLNKKLAIGLFILNTLDFLTTYYGLEYLGLKEMNNLTNIYLLAGKMVLTIAFYEIAILTDKTQNRLQTKFLTITLSILTVFYIGVVLNNLYWIIYVSVI